LLSLSTRLLLGRLRSCAPAWLAPLTLLLPGPLVAQQAYPLRLNQSGPSRSFLSAQQDPGQGFPYRLGPGDRLRMSVFKVEGYEAAVDMLADGTINLPRLGSVTVGGLTINQARDRIARGYDRYLRWPIVYLDLIAPRPVRVTLIREVQKPGFYALTQDRSSSTLQAAGPASGSTQVSSAGWPTLVDAVQRGGAGLIRSQAEFCT